MNHRTKALSADRTMADALPGLAAATGFALLTAVAANAAVRLPFTPVPVTLQVFAVLLAGLVLGSRLAALSMVEYAVIGALGAPVFANGGAGAAYLAGPTGGYILGFIFAAWLVGTLAGSPGKSGAARGFLAACSGVLVIYLCGGTWLASWMMLAGKPASEAMASAVTAGMLPFVLADLLKAGAAALAASRRFNA